MKKKFPIGTLKLLKFGIGGALLEKMDVINDQWGNKEDHPIRPSPLIPSHLRNTEYGVLAPSLLSEAFKENERADP